MGLPLSERPHRIPLASILGLALLAAAPLQAGVNRWTSIGPDGGSVTALAFSADGGTAWAGTKKLGVLRSADNGRTWTAAGLGQSGYVGDLAASPEAPGRVYATTSSGVFRSDDAGLHWTAINTGLPVVNGRVDAFRVATEPTNPEAVWAAGSKKRALYRSTNLGARWRYAGQGLRGVVLDIAAHPKRAGVVFAATDRGLFRSADSGGHWSPWGLYSFVVSRVAFDRVQPRHLYAITLEEGIQHTHPGTVFISDDEGASWKPGSERPGYEDFELAVDPAHAGTAWLSTAFGFSSVLKTTDGGQHWQGVLKRDRFAALALAVNPLRPGTVLVGQLEPGVSKSEEGAVLRTDDGGTSWSPGTGIAALSVRQVVPDPSEPGALYARAFCCLPWKRTGADQPFTPISTGYYGNLTLDPKTPSTLYVANGALFKSLDAGATWQKLSSLLIYSIALDPAHPSTLYGTILSDFTYAISRSDDGGLSWNTLSSTTEFFTTWLTVTGTSVYANDYGSFRQRLRRSVDGGTTWTTLLDMTIDPVRLQAVAEDPRDPQRLWTAFIQFGGGPQNLPATGGIYRSTDGGAHWSLSRLAGNLPVFALAVDPTNSNRVWAASAGAVFLSEDGGATWVSSSEGLPAADVLDLSLDPFDPDTVYAGTDGGSAYVYTRRTS
jgi:photosystem II stability/assembly factor-like uncharacterized protein